MLIIVVTYQITLNILSLVDLIKKKSEKDIAIDNNVSPNTVERVIDSYYELDNKVYKLYLLMNLNLLNLQMVL